jgi:hypothetical protein
MNARYPNMFRRIHLPKPLAALPGSSAALSQMIATDSKSATLHAVPAVSASASHMLLHKATTFAETIAIMMIAIYVFRKTKNLLLLSKL